MFEHTPEPWYWEEGEYDCGLPCTVDGCPGHPNGIPTYLDPVGIFLEEYPDDLNRWIADSHVIKAAPDTLAVCKAIVKIESLYDQLGDGDDYLRRWQSSELKDILNAARVAILKTQGERA